MVRQIIVFAAMAAFSCAALAAEYVREGWPGEGTPKLTASNDQLVIHKAHDTTSDTRQLKYKAGWLIVWDQSKLITRKSARWTVKREISKGSCGTLSPGTEVALLQFETQGWATFRVEDKICSLKATRSSDFDKADEWPRVEWWVRVLDNSKAPIGWLLVEAKQVNLLLQ